LDLERLKKNRSHAERGYLMASPAWTFGEWCRSSTFGEGAGLKNSVTEPKQSQNPKRPVPFCSSPNGYSIF
jgi:hypothetical protein